MANEPKIQGKIYSFGCIETEFPSGRLVMYKSIKYNCKIGGKVITDYRGIPAGYTTGKFEGSLEVEITRATYNEISAYASQYGGIFSMGPIPVVVVYDQGTQDKDELEFKIMDISDFGGKEGDDACTVKLKGPMTAIPIVNGVPIITPKE